MLKIGLNLKHGKEMLLYEPQLQDLQHLEHFEFLFDKVSVTFI